MAAQALLLLLLELLEDVLQRNLNEPLRGFQQPHCVGLSRASLAVDKNHSIGPTLNTISHYLLTRSAVNLFLSSVFEYLGELELALSFLVCGHR